MKVELRAIDPKKADMLAKLANLDARAMPIPWKLTKFDAELSHKRTHGVGVIETATGNLLAYLIYDVMREGSVRVVRLAVSPEQRRKKFASRLMDKAMSLARAMSTQPRLYAEANERDVEAWKFLRTYGERSGLEVKAHLVRHDPDDYFGFTFLVKEQMACV